jgi:hypothetical protein
MTAAGAAVLQHTLMLEDKEVAARRARAKQLLSQVHGARNAAAARAIPGGESGFLRLALLAGAGDRIVRPDLGALPGYPMTLDQHVQLRPVLFAGERAGKGSVRLRDKLFTIPTHSRIDQSDVARLSEWLNGEEAEARVVAQFS